MTDAGRAWQATLEGRYEEALSYYGDILSQADSLGERMNRGTTRLLVRDYKGAKDDFLTARQNQQQSPIKVVNSKIGVALWLEGQRELACVDWADEIRRRQAGEVTHTDGAGGVEVPALLWWASAHQELRQWRGLAEEELRSRFRTKQCQRSLWPGSIAPFLLGKTLDKDFISAATLPQYPRLQARQLCQCYFYIGAVHLSKSEIELYQSCLRLALSSSIADVILEAEYHLAVDELS